MVSGSCKDVTAPPPVDSISVSELSLDLVPGETANLTVVTKDIGGVVLTQSSNVDR